MRYLLDTDICIHITKEKPMGLRARFLRMQPGEAGMSIVTYCELVFGANKSQRKAENLARIRELEHLIPVVPLNRDAADHYGRIRIELEKRGTPIGAYGLLIAAQALALELILVSNNEREFRRVPGLRVENWALR